VVFNAQLLPNCRHLTSVPHVAGTVRDREQAEWLRDRFIESGLDEAKTASYEVLLSYPRSDGVVNRVSLIDDVGNVQFETVGRQTPLGSAEESSDEVQVNFNAYSGNGVVEVIHYILLISYCSIMFKQTA